MIDPRQMSMMMKKLGVQMQDIPDVKEVVIRTATKEYHIRRASVSLMRAQGSETWQVQGKADIVELAGGTTASGGDKTTKDAVQTSGKPDFAAAAPSTDPDDDASPSILEQSGAAAALPISDDDLKLVMQQTGKDRATARKALEENEGDLAAAIVALSG